MFSWVFRFALRGTNVESSTDFTKLEFFLVWLQVIVTILLESGGGIDIDVFYSIYFWKMIY